MIQNIAKLKATLKRCASRQKRTLIYRVINPARYLVDLANVKLARGNVTGTAHAPPTRMLLISDIDAYCSEEQFNAFSSYRSELRYNLRVISLHVLLHDALLARRWILPRFDVIGLKMSYRTAPAEALRIMRAVADAANGRCIIYFDGDDDLCVQWPEILPYVNLYVKKHVFRERRNYLTRFAGKSNLHDYVHRKYGHSFSARDYGNYGDKYTLIAGSGPVPATQLDKISLGYNVALDRMIMNLYKEMRHRSSQVAKENDIVYRGSAPSEVWSYHLRKDIGPILERLGRAYRVILPNKRVTLKEYYSELMDSRICICPFGYGEICWRDFEAVLCGCLVIKPDMSHVETNPDIFKPYETYVPVRWDFSDLEEKCRHYLAHESERVRIASQAFLVLDEFYRNDGFLKSVSNMLDRVRNFAQGSAVARYPNLDKTPANWLALPWDGPAHR